jgi:alkyldihydroxyacetonephosphate synthase
MKIYESIEIECRDEMIKAGGSITHHHGIGKVRKLFKDTTESPLAIAFQKNLKEFIDPKNIFAANNTIYRREGEHEEDLAHLSEI